MVKAAQNRLLNFAQVVHPQYTANPFHEDIAEHLEEALKKVQKKEKVRIILQIPPRHGKSLLATTLFPAWALGKDPTLPVITTSYSGDLAEKFGGECKDIVSSPEYNVIFPESKLRKDQKAKGDWKLTSGGSYKSVGVGGSITGRGAKLLIIDDPIKSREEAESLTYRNRVWEWYRSTLYSRMEGYGAIIVIMQRWHGDDLVARLMEQQEELKAAGKPCDEWQLITYPAIATKDESFRKEGEALWPEKFPLEILDNIKENQGIYNWISQYQQDPILSEAQEFKNEYFKYFEEQELVQIPVRYTTTVDPAISQKDGADNSVVLTVAKEVNGPRWFRVRETAGKFTPKQLIDIIFQHHTEYNSEVFVETVAYQKALKFYIEEEQRRREQYFSIHELKSKGNKELRIRGLLPLYQNGIIYHRKSDLEYETEALQFPRGKHDDRIDAMAMQLEAVKNTKMSHFVNSHKKMFKGYFRRR